MRYKIKITDQLIMEIFTKRNEKKIKGEELSLILNKSPSYISQIENGRIKTILKPTLFKLFSILIDNNNDADIEEFIKSIIIKNNIKKKKELFDMSYIYVYDSI